MVITSGAAQFLAATFTAYDWLQLARTRKPANRDKNKDNNEPPFTYWKRILVWRMPLLDLMAKQKNCIVLPALLNLKWVAMQYS